MIVPVMHPQAGINHGKGKIIGLVGELPQRMRVKWLLWFCWAAGHRGRRAPAISRVPGRILARYDAACTAQVAASAQFSMPREARHVIRPGAAVPPRRP